MTNTYTLTNSELRTALCNEFGACVNTADIEREDIVRVVEEALMPHHKYGWETAHDEAATRAPYFFDEVLHRWRWSDSRNAFVCLGCWEIDPA